MSDMSDEFPSDSSTEDIVDVESQEYEPTASEDIMNSILDDLPSEGEGGGPILTSISKETRAKINEALLKLEAMNPTSEPTNSSLLNGVWTLKYAGGYDSEGALQSPTRQIALFLYSGGYSPGLFALSLAGSLPGGIVEVGDLEIGKHLTIMVNRYLCVDNSIQKGADPTIVQSRIRYSHFKGTASN